eukprot:TRINITY_DN19150_c0_g1_i1.p1 TRINITY_DN19150_c0_g1~~TRINITY_DN19150_c0_g1_i1.p1  ORF type:complete len:396 (-),score=86.95 TRINITY_DN19150_c0_g1_i1:98-1285(-)
MGLCSAKSIEPAKMENEPAKMENTQAKADTTSWIPFEPETELPLEADVKLTTSYSCEVLHTTKGFVRGDWAKFVADGFYRAIPGDGVKVVRHILIHALDLIRYAEREGENPEAELLGEGSYAKVFGSGAVAAKIISDRERPWVHQAAVANILQADRLGIGPKVYGHGTVTQDKGGRFCGTVIFMERLLPLRLDADEDWPEKESLALLQMVARLGRAGFFHNDLKLPNVMRRGDGPVMVDFDLMERWTMKVAVTSSCIEYSLQNILEPLSEETAGAFREFYDLTVLSMTLQDNHLYRTVLRRLEDLWRLLEAPVFHALVTEVGKEKLAEIPFEVLVRVPLKGVSVNLLDLRGNLFAHLELSEKEDSDPGNRLTACEYLPQLIRSDGVYWPSKPGTD